MSQTSSINGNLFARTVEDLRKLVAAGEVSREELPRWLLPEDLVFLENPPSPAGWYPVRSYGRFLEALKDIEGGGSIDYLIERGARSADRLLEAGHYQQLEYLSRTQHRSKADAHERFLAFGRDLKLLNSLSRALANFGTRSVKIDPDHPDRYLIESVGFQDAPEAYLWASLGFMNRMAAIHGDPDLWHWERPTPDVVLFRMTRPV